MRVESRESKVEIHPLERGGQPSALDLWPSTAFGAFTLIELLVVITILGILAALTVPALKNLGKSSVNISASRQLLDGVARARQLALSQRTTVYMVFVPTNFWMVGGVGVPPGNSWWNVLTPAQQIVVTNLCTEQLSGYNFVAQGAMGDQPGQHAWHYLAPWQSLPDGSYIDVSKFTTPGTVISSSASPLYQQWNTDYPHPDGNIIYAFSNIVTVPFPTETSASGVALPYIAFDYRGQLVSGRDEYIPLAHGNVSYGIDPSTRTPQLTLVGTNDITEMPPGNNTNIAYNIVHIGWLTGRAVLENHKLGP